MEAAIFGTAAIPASGTIQIPRIEDEISEKWQNYSDTHPANRGAEARQVFEAGFRAARTFTYNGTIGAANV